MRIIDNKLYIEVKDFVASGSKESTINSYTCKENGKLNFTKIRGAKLFPWETVGDKWKEQILVRFGEPLEYIRKAPIKARVKYDLEAERFFASLKIKSVYSLSDEWITKTTCLVSWIKMIIKYGSKEAARREFDMAVDTFYLNVGDLMKAENIKPYSYKRLCKNIKGFLEEGYIYFIHGSTGKTSNAAKIKDERSEAVLLSLIEHPNQHDDVMVCFLYNIWAKENGYKEIESAATVGIRRRKKEPEITIGRYGNSKMNEKFIRQVKGFKPTRALHALGKRR